MSINPLAHTPTPYFPFPGEGEEVSTNPLKPLMDEILALSDMKQEDYGSDSDPFANVRRSEELGIPAWLGAIVRFGDKWQRIQQFARRRTLANESFEDSLKDAAVYALIALQLYREANSGSEGPEQAFD